jgi:hypothetical protein
MRAFIIFPLSKAGFPLYGPVAAGISVLSTAILTAEVNEMSPKELLYLEDALGHEKFLLTQCRDASQNLQDPALKQYAQQMAEKHQKIFSQFLNLV